MVVVKVIGRMVCKVVLSLLRRTLFFFHFLYYSPEEVQAIAQEMIGHKLITKQTGEKGINCNKVMVCGAVNILKEFYLAIRLERALGCSTIIASS